MKTSHRERDYPFVLKEMHSIFVCVFVSIMNEHDVIGQGTVLASHMQVHIPGG